MIFGAAFIFLGTHGLLFLKRIKQDGITSQGTIVGFESDKYPIIEFNTQNNETIKGIPYINVSANMNGFQLLKKWKDKSLTVVYFPENPSKFLVKREESTYYAGTILVAILGIGIIIFGICELAGVINLFRK